MPNYHRYYLENRYVFLTVVTYQRQPILINNIKLLRNSFKQTLLKYNFEIFGIVILPDHFHVIIKPENVKDFSNIVGSIKKHFTYNYNGASKRRTLPDSRQKRKESTIWQRRFYDHIIRDEDDLYKHLNYIHYNPVKHGYTNGVKQWQYSSFSKFVQAKFYEPEWGNVKDIENIQDMTLE